VGVVVLVTGVRLAVLAEVCVMAYSALVASALDVGKVLLVLAERTIAVDAVMAATAGEGLSEGLVDGHEAVTRVNDLGALQALRAVVPVGTIQTLVADTVDELVASIAHCIVACVAARVAKCVAQSGE
jgi:hypothetical protein